MLNTLGDVVTCALAIAAIVLVPAGVIRAWFPFIVARVEHMLMSRSALPPLEKTDIGAVSIPVLDTSINAGIDWQQPRVSAYLTDDEFLILLARQKLRDGKYRLSANDVYKVVGGNRNDVLAIVRALRETSDFRQLTPDHRAELGVGKR